MPGRLLTAPQPAPAAEREVPAGAVARDKSEVISSFDPADFPVPTGREEEWRFTPRRRISQLFEPLEVADGATVTVAAPEDVIGIDRAQGPVQLGQWLVPIDRPSALAWAGAPEPVAITVPPHAELSEPVVITIRGVASSYQLIRITVEHDAAATVVIDHRGTGSQVENIEVEVGPRARLTLVSIQDWDRDAVHLGRTHLHVGRDAAVTQVAATIGGDVVRLVSTVDFDGPGGSAELLGACFADAGQHLEHRLFVDHNVPDCRSNVVYKGALQGAKAHTVWVGDVLIRANATGTSTYEVNRNLLLGEGARADSVPNLEIETGEIAGAGHASATGRFDDEQLFYLQARGIPADVARRLVVRGFFADVIERVPGEAMRARLWASIEAELGGMS